MSSKMEKPEAIIHIQQLSKQYRLGQKVVFDTLRERLSDIFHKRPDHFSEQKVIRALYDVDLKVYPGEVLGIIGFNGSGKSTLLKLISLITPPSAGEIHIQGSVSSLLDIGLGFHPDLTGRENIFLNGAILGMKRGEIKTKFADIVAFSGIDEKFLDTPVKRYSSGMYVRLAFSIAAHLDSDILLIDEVLAVGDYEFQKKCLDKIDNITRSKRTVLFVSHNLAAIERLCNRTIVINAGEKVFDGKTSEAIQFYTHLHSEQSHLVDVSLNTVHRSGSGAVRFQNVKILNMEKAPVTSIATADDIIVRLNLKVKQTIHYPRIAIYMKSMSGQTIFRIYSVDTPFTIPKLTTDTTVDCYLKRMPLLAGDYYLNLWIADENGTCDIVDHACDLAIYRKGKVGSINSVESSNAGDVWVETEWNLIKY